MPKEDLSDSETQENGSDSSSEDVEPATNEGGISEYEKQRLQRIEENRARMEALGLHKMASTLMGSVRHQKKKSEPKGKRKLVEEDEEYRPSEGEEGLSLTSEGDGDDDDEEFVVGESTGSRTKKMNKKKSTPNKKVNVQNLSRDSDFIDDDDALMQAIALSLQDSAGFLDVANNIPSKSSDICVIDGNINARKRNSHIKEDATKRKRKKSIGSRVQMTEDELILHFFQFDEAGKGSITLRDLWRVAAAHDFTWSDKEMSDMIYFFDSDGDGKLSLDDFHKIVGRCKMIKASENDVMS